MGTLLLAFVTGQRLVELVWARRNTRRLIAAGGIEFGQAHYLVMIAIHVAWLAGLWVLAPDRTLDPLLLAVFVVLQVARLWVIATLGKRWTTRVVVVLGERRIATGPYRMLRHPNYLIVVAEIAILPAAFGLFLYAVVFSALNAAILIHRVRVEEFALAWARRKRRSSISQA